MTHNRFVILNDRPEVLTLNVEPEGVFFPLESGEQVVITDTFAAAPVTLRFSQSAGGEPVISIWPGDGDVTVEKDGTDVLTLPAPHRVRA